MRFGATGAIALVLLSAAPARATDAADSAAPARSATERAASDAVGIFCVPVMIAGRLPVADLIAASHFTPGAQPHPKPMNEVGFSLQIDNGDLVEVFVDEAKHGCTIHIHGAAPAIDDYRAALRAQNWQQIVPAKEAETGNTLEGWRVAFGQGVGSAIQIVSSRSPDPADLGRPQIIAVFLWKP